MTLGNYNGRDALCPAIPPANLITLKFDDASKTFELSVRDLAEDGGFRRVGFDRGDGWRRLGIGTEVHSRVLASRRGNKSNCMASLQTGMLLPARAA